MKQNFIMHAVSGDVAVIVRTGEKGDSQVSAFVVEKGTPGFSSVRKKIN